MITKKSISIAIITALMMAIIPPNAWGANVNIQDKNGFTPLTWAVLENNPNKVKALLKQGASVHIQDKYGDTPLMYAIRENNPDIVKALLDNGADVNIQDKDGYTPLMWAVIYNNPDIIKLLLDNGADVNVVKNIKDPKKRMQTLQLLKDLQE